MTIQIYDNSNSYEIFKWPYLKIQFEIKKKTIPESPINKDYDGEKQIEKKFKR